MARSTSSRSPRSSGIRWLLGTEILIWVLDTTAPRLTVGRSPAGVPGALRSIRGRPAARGHDRGTTPCAAPDRLVGGGRPSLAARLDAWLADARVEGSADARARERWLHRGRRGRRHLRRGAARPRRARAPPSRVAHRRGPRATTGASRCSGADFVALRTAGGAEVLVAIGAIASVRTAPLVEPAVGERVVTTELRLGRRARASWRRSERACCWCARRPRRGRRASCARWARTWSTMRTDGEPPATAYVPPRRASPRWPWAEAAVSPSALVSG